ncbi:aldo/keto reductase [Sciscionella marina]|uniref:aldo/keto reductase n=1 Tax=Sciscionella marina TaxID=508770 RepID=UPI00036FFEFA|nr:aldo/keto reductase [Sciscionella marina]
MGLATPPALPATASGTFWLGGDLPVHRIGFGAMQLTGPGHWGPPPDLARARAVLRDAVALGVNHIDTADAYGPHTGETLIHDTLHPYPERLVIATKGGMTRPGPNRWQPHGDPDYLRRCVDASLTRLGLERIDLYYLHRIDPHVPLADQLGVLTEAQQAGKIRHLGVSKVNLDQLREARTHAEIVAVQNRSNTAIPDTEVHDYCTRYGIAYVPFAPLGAGALLPQANKTRAVGEQLRWQLDRSPVTLPIPGTGNPAHLHHNIEAARKTRTP